MNGFFCSDNCTSNTTVLKLLVIMKSKCFLITFSRLVKWKWWMKLQIINQKMRKSTNLYAWMVDKATKPAMELGKMYEDHRAERKNLREVLECEYLFLSDNDSHEPSYNISWRTCVCFYITYREKREILENATKHNRRPVSYLHKSVSPKVSMEQKKSRHCMRFLETWTPQEAAQSRKSSHCLCQTSLRIWKIWIMPGAQNCQGMVHVEKDSQASNFEKLLGLLKKLWRGLKAMELVERCEAIWKLGSYLKAVDLIESCRDPKQTWSAQTPNTTLEFRLSNLWQNDTKPLSTCYIPYLKF